MGESQHGRSQESSKVRQEGRSKIVEEEGSQEIRQEEGGEEDKEKGEQEEGCAQACQEVEQEKGHQEACSEEGDAKDRQIHRQEGSDQEEGNREEPTEDEGRSGFVGRDRANGCPVRGEAIAWAEHDFGGSLLFWGDQLSQSGAGGNFQAAVAVNRVRTESGMRRELWRMARPAECGT